MTGWPDERKSVPEEIRGFWSYIEGITANNGVLFKRDQVIVLSSLRAEMLRKIHKAHQDSDISIRRAWEWLFWPGTRLDIRETCLSCGICSQYQAERRPWSKISADLLAPAGKQYHMLHFQAKFRRKHEQMPTLYSFRK